MGIRVVGIIAEFQCSTTSVARELVRFFQAEDGIRDPLWSRGLGDVYKRQVLSTNITGVTVSFLLR